MQPLRPKIHATGNTARIRSQSGMIGIGLSRRARRKNEMPWSEATGLVVKYFQASTPRSAPTNPPKELSPFHTLSSDSG